MNNRPQQILTELASTITQSILAALGNASIETIFLAGSVAEDRIAWYDADDHIEIYSDLDLYVIVSPGVDILEAREKARSVIPSLPLATDEYTIYREPDIGVFDEEYLLSEPDRPGTVQIPDYHRVLYGRKDIAEKTRRFDAAQIGREEALYLLENRLVEGAALRERMGDDPADGILRSIYYTSLKQCLDVVSAVLIADGVFVCGADDRMLLFRNRSASTGIVLDQQSRDTIEYAYNHMQHLQRSLRQELHQLVEVRARAEALQLVVWKLIAASLFKKAPSVGWEALLAMRCRSESIMNNLRESVIISRRCGRGAWTGAMLWTARPRMRVRTALRLAGICEIHSLHGARDLGDSPRRFVEYLDSLTAALRCTDGTVYQRARALLGTIS